MFTYLEFLLRTPATVGDPDDRNLRKVEREVMVPKVMRELAKTQKCPEEVAAFESCCKSNSLMMVFNCRKENETLKECQAKWYKNDQFVSECTEIYLKQRAEYRRTGLTVKQRAAQAANVGSQTNVI